VVSKESSSSSSGSDGNGDGSTGSSSSNKDGGIDACGKERWSMRVTTSLEKQAI
jgi:hypothetical protein